MVINTFTMGAQQSGAASSSIVVPRRAFLRFAQLNASMTHTVATNSNHALSTASSLVSGVIADTTLAWVDLVIGANTSLSGMAQFIGNRLFERGATIYLISVNPLGTCGCACVLVFDPA